MSSVFMQDKDAMLNPAETGVQSADLRKFLKILIILLVSALTIEVVFHFIISPQMRITRIEINSNPACELCEEEVLAMAGLFGELSYFSVDPEVVALRLESQAIIRQARVVRKLPGTLIIDIEERFPLVMSLVNIEDRTVPVVFDEEGVAFQIGKSITDWNLPVISGLEFSGVQLGMKLPRELYLFLDQLAVLRAQNPAMYSLLSEIEFIRSNNIDYEAVLYPACYDTKVRIGLEISEELLNYILVILDTIEDVPEARAWSELDFRSDVPVYRIGEG